LHETEPALEEIKLPETEDTPFNAPTAGQGENSTVSSCGEVVDFTILIGKTMCEEMATPLLANNNETSEEKCQSFKEICIVEKCCDSYLEKDQTHPLETCSVLVPAIKTFASPLGGSCTTMSSFSVTSPAVFQQEGSFSFPSSSIAAHSTAPGFSFGLSPSSVGSAAATAPSGFGVGGTAMRSFGVSTPRPFAFEGSAPNNAATSFPAVFSAAATTVQSISFSFGSNTSPVSRFDTPSQTTTPSFPSSSLGLGGRSLWTPRRTSKPVRRY